MKKILLILFIITGFLKAGYIKWYSNYDIGTDQFTFFATKLEVLFGAKLLNILVQKSYYRC